MNLINKIAKPILAKDLPPLRGLGPLGLEGKGAEAGATTLSKALSLVIGFMTIFAALWFLIQIIVSGYNFIAAAGDAQKIKTAQDKIVNSLIGLSIVVAAIFLLSFIGEIFKIDFLDIPGAIRQLSP